MQYQIALAQFKPIRKDVSANIRKLQHLLTKIKADLIVLPELANTGYLYASKEKLRPFSEPEDGSGPFLSALVEIAKQSGGVIVSGYAERQGDAIFNSAAAVTQSGVIENYRKTHLYNNEKTLFTPGDRGFKVFEWRNVKIGMMICFDWIFPEACRTLALAGAQILAHPANLVLPYCQDAMITRSIENRVFTITANRIGEEKEGNQKLSFTGTSQMTEPSGAILYRGPKSKTTVHITSIDPELSLDKKISDKNHLMDDRRPSFYEL